MYKKSVIVILVIIVILVSILIFKILNTKKQTSKEPAEFESTAFTNETTDLKNQIDEDKLQNIMNISNTEVARNIIQTGQEINDRTQNVVENVDMDSPAIKAFNSNYEAYKGSQKGSAIKAMLNTVGNHNLIDTQNTITVQYSNIQYLDNMKDLKDKIQSSKKYMVEFQYNNATHYIEKIIIKDD